MVFDRWTILGNVYKHLVFCFWLQIYMWKKSELFWHEKYLSLLEFPHLILNELYLLVFSNCFIGISGLKLTRSVGFEMILHVPKSWMCFLVMNLIRKLLFHIKNHLKQNKKFGGYCKTTHQKI